MLKNEFTWDPRWGQNVIDKVKLKTSWLIKGVLRLVLLHFR